VKFSIIANLLMDAARAYRMIHPGATDTSAVRATFIIGPQGILRAMAYAWHFSIDQTAANTLACGTD